jgi:beta-glucosidase
MLCVFLLLFTGCGKEQQAQTEKESEANLDTQEQDEDKVEASDVYLDATLPTKDRVDILLSQMSLLEKAGQMLQGERGRVTQKEMTDLRLGSVLSGGGSYPGMNSLVDWTSMFDQLQQGAMNTKHRIPMLYGVDAVHGLGLLRGAVVYPHNIGLGAANDPELMHQMGAAVAEEMKLVKILWNFGPCVAVNLDPRWGRTYECYSSDTAIVSSLAHAYMLGMQEQGVAATAKHYVGDGGTTYGTGELNSLLDRGDTRVTEEELRRNYLKPYEVLVDSGVKIVMASFSSYQGVKMHENSYLINDVLKAELGFAGFVVSDWEALTALSGTNFEEDVALAINAGVDMLMEPNNYKDAMNAIVNNVNSGKISEERINDAVSRILTVKFDLGLFEDPYQEKLAKEVTELGTAGYRELAKKLVAKSQVLLKNEGTLLPLKQGQKVYVTGPAINDMGLQCGGWGLTWQGNMDENGGKITEGTTILEGIQEYGKKYDIEIITDEDQATDADVVILALGEIPYAEFEGDTTDLSITGSLAHPGNQMSIEQVEGLHKPTITLLVAGRNVIISDYMNQWDSIVMSYLPGTEGDGVASVLFGEEPFHGKLPMPYYQSVKDIGNTKNELLYEFGYGLTAE